MFELSQINGYINAYLYTLYQQVAMSDDNFLNVLAKRIGVKIEDLKVNPICRLKKVNVSRFYNHFNGEKK